MTIDTIARRRMMLNGAGLERLPFPAIDPPRP